MSSEAIVWVGNLKDPTLVGPMIYPGKFGSGAGQAVNKGDLLKRTGNTNTEWVPSSDYDPSSNAGLAIANQNIVSGDLAGFYEIIIPRPGDIFKATLAAASAVAPETALYYASATTLTVTPGTNILGYTVFGPNQPGLQKRLSQGQLGDKGTTFLSTLEVYFVFRAAYSHYATLQKA